MLIDKEFSIKIFAEYRQKGFFVLKDIFSKKFMESVFDEIISSSETIKYLDRNKKIRRIEEIYDKGKHLKKLNEDILEILNLIFHENFIIFKDKYNAKPPGGEGFYAHYDGIFLWEDSEGNLKKGWHEYAKEYINVLVSIDQMNSDNGPLQVSKVHKDSFENLLKKTKNNGTPDLTQDIEASLCFEEINLEPGDIVFFNSTCPHKSSKNNSNLDRRTIYYTYNKLSEGDNYKRYFDDKRKSKTNQSKSLSGEI